MRKPPPIDLLMKKALSSPKARGLPPDVAAKWLKVMAWDYATDYCGCVFVPTKSERPVVQHFSKGLQAAAQIYLWAAEEEAVRAKMQRRRGRPKNLADPLFIFRMREILGTKIGWRSYDSDGGKKVGRRGGLEQKTKFQRFCNGWLRYIDPDRKTDLTPHAFREAKAMFGRRG